MNNNYRYQLEKYRGRATRHVCPQCGRKQVFTRYIDTHNNNMYVNEKVGKCNRIDKCGYHYTPRMYFEDNPWLKDKECTYIQNNRNLYVCTPVHEPQGIGTLPWWFVERTLSVDCDYKQWLRNTLGHHTAEQIIADYHIGGVVLDDGVSNAAIFWQVDSVRNARTGKIMNFDPATGKRLKGEEQLIDWAHSVMRREGALPEGWNLVQCLYGESLLERRKEDIVALCEGAKTAHIGSALMPEMVWVALDSMTGLCAERLYALNGRDVILFPDEGRGYEEWTRRIEPIARSVHFRYSVSDFIQRNIPNSGGDIADLIAGGGSGEE